MRNVGVYEELWIKDVPHWKSILIGFEKSKKSLLFKKKQLALNVPSTRRVCVSLVFFFNCVTWFRRIWGLRKVWYQQGRWHMTTDSDPYLSTLLLRRNKNTSKLLLLLWISAKTFKHSAWSCRSQLWIASFITFCQKI